MFSSYSLSYQKKWSLFKMFMKSALYLTKKDLYLENKSNCLQKLTFLFLFFSCFFSFFFLDIIMLMLLAKFEFDKWFHLKTNKKTKKKRNYQKIGFPLKPDDVIVMSSNVHEWKGKPRSIVWCNRSLKRKLHPMIVSNIATSKRFLLYHFDLQLTLYVVAFERLSSLL